MPQVEPMQRCHTLRKAKGTAAKQPGAGATGIAPGVTAGVRRAFTHACICVAPGVCRAFTHACICVRREARLYRAALPYHLPYHPRAALPYDKSKRVRGRICGLHAHGGLQGLRTRRDKQRAESTCSVLKPGCPWLVARARSSCTHTPSVLGYRV